MGRSRSARTRSKRAPRRRALTKERIIRAAIELLDERGLEALTMRDLATSLGTGAMSLYNHVANKDEVLGGVVEVVAQEIHVPTPGADWRASMRQRAVSARDVIVRHPWAARLLESQPELGASRLHALDATLGSLRCGGFSIDGAARALLLLDSFTYGFALQETSWQFDTASPEAAAASMGPAEAVQALPYVAELAEYVLSPAPGAGFNHQLEFERGLELVLDAMARLMAG